MKYFPGQEKVRDICDWSENFCKVFEKSRNLKIMAKLEKMYFLDRQYRHISLSARGLFVKEIIPSLGEQILSFKDNPSFKVTQHFLRKE